MRALGFPIHIEKSWFIIAGLVSWSLATGFFPAYHPELPSWIHWFLGISAAVLLFVCIVLHELGHSLVARLYGIPVACVSLFLFGGVAQITHEARSPGAEFWVALAGPLVSAGIAFACFVSGLVLPTQLVHQQILFALVHYLLIVNLMLLAFNLLPGYPLDGGRILRALIWAVTGDMIKATRVASWLGTALGTGLALMGVWALIQQRVITGLWYIALGFFLRRTALGTYRFFGQLKRRV